MLPRRDFLTKELCRLLQGGKVAVHKHSQSPVLPWARLAYGACLSAGSTAVLADNQQIGAPTRNYTELSRLPSERIADNALGAVKMASLTGFAPVISCLRGRCVG